MRFSLEEVQGTVHRGGEIIAAGNWSGTESSECVLAYAHFLPPFYAVQDAGMEMLGTLGTLGMASMLGRLSYCHEHNQDNLSRAHPDTILPGDYRFCQLNHTNHYRCHVDPCEAAFPVVLSRVARYQILGKNDGG